MTRSKKTAQKLYHIGQKFTTFKRSQKLAPCEELHACFTLINPKVQRRSEVQSLSQMSDEELMMEVEVLRVCDAAFRNSRLAQRYEIRVGSSELLDAIFEECQV